MRGPIRGSSTELGGLRFANPPYVDEKKPAEAGFFMSQSDYLLFFISASFAAVCVTVVATVQFKLVAPGATSGV